MRAKSLLWVACLALMVSGCVGNVNVNMCGPQDPVSEVFTKKEPDAARGK